MSVLLFMILFLLLLHPKIVSNSVMEACTLWFQVLLPTMYPSFVLLDLIHIAPLTHKISHLIYPIFRKLFHIQYEHSAFLILLSVLLGAPASTKMIFEAYQNQWISEDEKNRLICHFSTLSFPYTLMICSAFQISLLWPYLIFFGLALFGMHFYQPQKESRSVFQTFNKDYLRIFISSITKNIQILFNILGILIFFRVLIHLFFPNGFVLYPYFEILGGLHSLNSFESYTKGMVLSAIGFLGFSVHIQIYSIDDSFPYRKFLKYRLCAMGMGLLGFVF